MVTSAVVVGVLGWVNTGFGDVDRRKTSVECLPRDPLGRHNNRDFGTSGVRTLRLVLYGDGGQQASYEILHVWKVSGESCLSVFCLRSPHDLKRTTILLHETKGKWDPLGIWLYLPATDYVMRVESWRRQERILGSDFTYEELRFWLGVDRLVTTGYRKCVLADEAGYEVLTKFNQFGGSDSVEWIKATYFFGCRTSLLREAHFFRNGEATPFRVYTAESPVLVDGIWTPSVMRVRRLDTDQSTTMELMDASYQIAPSNSLFKPENLPNVFEHVEALANRRAAKVD